MGKTELEEQVESTVTDILLAVTDVSVGDFTAEVPVPDDEESPLGALCIGINQMIQALRERQEALDESNETVLRQADAIRELSTPILKIWHDVLVLPVIGVVDSRRASDIMERLLSEIRDQQARYVILDITGVEIVDTRTADHFVKLVKAARLLGATCLVTGIRPAVAQTLVDIGMDLTDVITRGDLMEGLVECFRLEKEREARRRHGRVAKRRARDG